MSISTMKQALEALERGRSQIIGALVQQDQDAAITALRQAIEQAEDKDADEWYENLLWGRQEPVAWVDVKDSYEGPYEFHGIERIGVGKHLLYTAPIHASDVSAKCVDETVKDRQEDWYGQWQWQCGYERGWDKAMEKREWVGLTKAEFEEAVDGLEDVEDCWYAIEAKLKEKNT